MLKDRPFYLENMYKNMRFFVTMFNIGHTLTKMAFAPMRVAFPWTESFFEIPKLSNFDFDKI